MLYSWSAVIFPLFLCSTSAHDNIIPNFSLFYVFSHSPHVYELNVNKKRFRWCHHLNITSFFLSFSHKEKKHVTLEFTDFRLQLIRQIFDKHRTQRNTRRNRPTAEKPLRLTARPFPLLNGGRPRRWIVCSANNKWTKIRSPTKYGCSKYNIGLCVTNSFRENHTLQE
jgi:hypothetical protein